jgi:hypothetical protein
MQPGTHISVADYRPFRARCRECAALLNGNPMSREPHPYLTKASRGKKLAHVSTFRCRICSGYLKRHEAKATALWS